MSGSGTRAGSDTGFGLDGVSVSYGDTAALQDADVEVPAGTVVAVVGGDGAGKTTMARALVGEIVPGRGSVRAPGAEQIGYQPSSAGSWAGLTVSQNIDFAAGVYGLGGKELSDRRAELLEAADLTKAKDRAASQLSGGMRRKLGFCMAIVHRPSLLVLDEPSTGVDPVSRIDLWRLISQAAADGMAVFMSTTYLDEAERAGHLVVLEGGQILVQGSYQQVRDRFTGTITRGEPVRKQWSWRRGRQRHEYWPADQAPPGGATTVQPDLEDIVISYSLVQRGAA